MSRIIYWNVRLWLLFRLIRYAWKLNEHEYDAMRPSRRGFANIKRADKMHMSAWYSVQTHGPFIRSLYVTSVPNTNRDVISDDGINYRKAPKRERERERNGQLFAVLIIIGAFLQLISEYCLVVRCWPIHHIHLSRQYPHYIDSLHVIDTVVSKLKL